MDMIRSEWSPFRAFFGDLPLEHAWTPAAEVDEDEKEFRLSFDLPGMKKEEIRIESKEKELTVSGERKGRGRFERSFVLPATVQFDKISAAYSDGVLTITVPKAEEAKPRVIPVGDGTNGVAA